MSLKVEFGNGATAQQFKLQAGTTGYAGDAAALNGPSVQESPSGPGTVGSELPDAPVTVSTVKVPNGATGTGGTVTITEDDGVFAFESSGWNAVKNAKATADMVQDVKFTDFVHVDVDFSAVTSTRFGSSIVIEDVKRGNVATAGGADQITISLASNDVGYQNTFNISSGGGSDVITMSKGSVSGIASVTDGRFTTVTIDAGSGNDTIDLSGLKLKLATITGGIGNDTMTGSNGADIYVYNAITPVTIDKLLYNNSGSDNVYGFQVGTDKLQLSNVAIKAVQADGTALNTELTLTDNTTIKLHGVTGLTLADSGLLLA